MNKFTQIWESLSPTEKQQLAIDADTSYAYLSQLSSGHRKPGRKMLRALPVAYPKITVDMLLSI